MQAATSVFEEMRAVNRGELLGLARSAPSVCALILRRCGFFQARNIRGEMLQLWYTPIEDPYSRPEPLERVWEMYCTSDKFAHLR